MVYTWRSGSLQSTWEAQRITPAFHDHSWTRVILGLGPPWTNKNLLPTSSSRTPPLFEATLEESLSLAILEAMAQIILVKLWHKQYDTIFSLSSKYTFYNFASHSISKIVQFTSFQLTTPCCRFYFKTL